MSMRNTPSSVQSNDLKLLLLLLLHSQLHGVTKTMHKQEPVHGDDSQPFTPVSFQTLVRDSRPRFARRDSILERPKRSWHALRERSASCWATWWWFRGGKRWRVVVTVHERQQVTWTSTHDMIHFCVPEIRYHIGEAQHIASASTVQCTPENVVVMLCFIPVLFCRLCPHVHDWDFPLPVFVFFCVSFVKLQCSGVWFFVPRLSFARLLFHVLDVSCTFWTHH